MSHHKLFRAILILAFLFVLSISQQSPIILAAPNTTFTVTKTADTNDGTCNGDCSLREAITAANANGAGADSITVPAGTYTLTIAGTGEDANATGDLDITAEVTINGAGAGSTIIQAGTIGYPSGSANGIDRVIELHGTDTITFIGVTIANGKVGQNGGGIGVGDATLSVIESSFSGNSGGSGGGIGSSSGTVIVSGSTFSNNSAVVSGAGIHTQAGTVVVSNSTFSNNSASVKGGGIGSPGGNVTVTNSTFSGNSADLGGGIWNNVLGTLTVTNSTFSGNLASTDGGGILNSGTLNLSNTILANSAGGGDCYNVSGDSIATNTANLIETNGPGGHMCGTPSVTTDPNLGALANNGGPTRTMAIDSSSPAYNAGDNTVCAAAPVSNKDQRGVTRPQNTTCDIGAFESNKQAGPILTVNTDEDSTDGFCDALVADLTDCTLREAINAANAVPSIDTIHFAADATIALSATLPALTAAVTIDGETHKVILSGDTNGDSVGDVRILKVNSGVIATLKNLTFTKGNPGADVGGAIYNNGNLTVTNSTFSDNKASEAGAIENESILTIANSTFSGNTATVGNGGAVYNYFASLSITNSTFSGNAAAQGSDLYNSGSSTLNLYNTILANSSSGANCYNDSGTVNGHHNLIETDSAGGNACGTTGVLNADPNLGALADNGGVTKTFALLALSPAMDAGDNATCAAAPISNKDQRGFPRPTDGDGDYTATCDIGSYEAANFAGCVAKPTKATLKKPKNDTTVTQQKVKFKWTRPFCTVDYQIIVKNATTGKTVFKKVVTGTQTKTTNVLLPGKYQWTVTARNGIGKTKSVKFTFTK